MTYFSSIYLKQLPIGPMENFVYLVGDRNKKECVIVDPAWDLDTILKKAAEDDIRAAGALLTHTHYDHANGVEDFIAKTSGKIYVHKAEADFLKGMKSRIEATEDGQQIKIGEVSITCFHTPGHTPGGQCYLAESGKEKEKHLLSGDTLFVGACGRCDLPGSSPEKMYESLVRLSKLDDDVVVLPGHDYGETPTSTIGHEKKTNPYYQCYSLDEFLHARMG